MNSRDKIQTRLEALRATYLQKLPEKIEEAEALWAALAGGPLDPRLLADLHRTLHSLAGSCAAFGLTALSDSARDLERSLKAIMDGRAQGHEAMFASISHRMKTLALSLSDGPEPAAPPAPAPRRPPAKPGGTRFNERKLIFLIEDDLSQLKHLAIQISHFGYAVKSFSKLNHLWTALQERLPDVIIMDIVFPEGALAGVDTIAQLQSRLEAPLPVIFISSRNDLDARLQAARAGGQAYFIKPLNIIDLIDKLDMLTKQEEVAPYRILIVDDEPELAQLHAAVLQEAGMLTCTANHPMQLLDPLIEFQPDLILMDIYMPCCNGQDLARAIRQMGACFTIPIVFLSSETNVHKQLTAMSVGGDDFLTKPIQPDHLISSVRIRAERMRIMRSLVERDGLTGLLNHTKTKEQLEVALERARRQNGHLTMAMIDIDFFKSVNDTYGHSTGDRVIVGLSRLLQQRLRKTDVVGRYGGEEFAVLLDTDIASAREILDEIRSSFSQIKHQCEDREFTVTFSCGLASFPHYRSAVSLNSAADKALYKAKNAGRNRVMTLDEAP